MELNTENIGIDSKFLIVYYQNDTQTIGNSIVYAETLDGAFMLFESEFENIKPRLEIINIIKIRGVKWNN